MTPSGSCVTHPQTRLRLPENSLDFLLLLHPEDCDPSTPSPRPPLGSSPFAQGTTGPSCRKQNLRPVIAPSNVAKGVDCTIIWELCDPHTNTSTAPRKFSGFLLLLHLGDCDLSTRARHPPQLLSVFFSALLCCPLLKGPAPFAESKTGGQSSRRAVLSTGLIANSLPISIYH